MTIKEIYESELKIEKLRSSLTGDMMSDLEVKSEIHSLEMKINGIKPEDSHFECEGCGS